MSMSNAIYLDPSAITWEPSGSEEHPLGRLLATVRIGHTHHHLEAIEVETNRKGNAEASDNTFNHVLDAAFVIAGNDASRRFESIAIDKRRYALLMTPYSL